MAIEEGVNRTESLSQMPTSEAMSPGAAPVTTQPLPVAPVAPAAPATSYVSDTKTTSTTHQQATSQTVTSQPSQQVGGDCLTHSASSWKMA